MSVTIELPEAIEQELADSWGVGQEELPGRILEAAAVDGYRQGVLSHLQVGELLHLDYWETEAFLKEHNAFLPYTLEDLEADRRTLQEVLTR